MAFKDRFPTFIMDAERAKDLFIQRVLFVLFPHYPNVTGPYMLNALGRAIGKIFKIPLELNQIAKNEFEEFLYGIEKLYEHLPYADRHINLTQESLSEQLSIIATEDMDFGISWDGQRFLPTGAKLLDDRLLNDSLAWLQDQNYTTIYEPYYMAVRSLLAARKDESELSTVVIQAFKALEGMAKIVCGNRRSFDKNVEQFVSKLKVSTHYTRVLKELAQYAHRIRHGAGDSQETPRVTYVEAESYLYNIGLMLRLASTNNRIISHP